MPCVLQSLANLQCSGTYLREIPIYLHTRYCEVQDGRPRECSHELPSISSDNDDSEKAMMELLSRSAAEAESEKLILNRDIHALVLLRIRHPPISCGTIKEPRSLFG